jgi:predicted ATP-dependent endonuclease of OLD family
VTFLVGRNNYAKSSIITAVEALLTLRESVVTPADYRVDSDGNRAKEIEITGYFSEISPEVAVSRGFKGRVIDRTYCYRKTYSLASTKPKIETKQYPYAIKEELKGVKKGTDLLDHGYAEEQVREILGLTDINKNLKKGWELLLPDAVEWDTEVEPEFVENPGGIPSIVNSKLPRLLRIPSFAQLSDIEKAEGKKTAIGECLSILFDDLLSDHPLANEIQDRLNQLEAQMSPEEEESLIRQLCERVNAIIQDVFPECGIKVIPSLQGVTEIIKPKYQVEMYSNIPTDCSRQGTGLVRTTLFSMLRYHSELHTQKELQTKPLMVAFEEPEIYLHPSAANLLRDTIYALGSSDQIICTTHSPWMIDLSRDPQSLTQLQLAEDDSVTCVNYGVSEKLNALQLDDRTRVKMLQMCDDELSRVFFCERAVIVEGDSELIAVKHTLRLVPEEVRKRILAQSQVVKARGKATVISLVKYLRALSIEPFVIHDRDAGTPGAEKFNYPICEAVGDLDRVVSLHECLEDALDMHHPIMTNPSKPTSGALHGRHWKMSPRYG